ncbi:MAG TPA: MlaD family protein [Caulobacteraceae bacterium]|nr:MlaD family protein [Caulobacteraceae bacterium]
MERNANYAVVGVISTVLLIALIVFIFWLTNFALSAQYDTYDIVFHGPIQGLSKGGDVQFNGIKVGDVSDIRLDKTDPDLVIAVVKVGSDTPVRADSVATLEPQGITGVNYIQITAGTLARPLLKDTVAPGVTPTIEAKGGTISTLLAGGGTVLQSAVETLDRVNRVLSDENIRKITAMIGDMQAVTAELRERKSIIADADKTLQSADQAAQQFRQLAKSGQTLIDTNGKQSLAKITAAAAQMQAAAAEAHEMLSKLQGPTTDFATHGLPRLASAITSVQDAAQNLNRLVSQIRRNPRGFIEKPAAKEVEVRP